MTATIEELEQRVKALEAAQNDTTQTQRWVVSKLGRIAAVQDEHTLRLERLETDVREVKAELRDVKAELREVKADIKGLRADLPDIVAEAIRDVLGGKS